MPKAKAIVKRRKAVKNIKKITRTMQLIATAKFAKALQRATASKPYTERITDLVAKLSQRISDIQHPLLETNTQSGRSAVLIISSNRGLCGGYNARILTAALDHLKHGASPADSDSKTALDVAGKKGIAYFKFLGRELRKTYHHFEDRVRFDEVDVLASEFIDLYTEKKLDCVHVVYMKFLSAAKQVPAVIQLLPLEKRAAEATEPDTRSKAGVQYDFSPAPDELLAELLPQTIRTRLFQCFVDAAVSEQIARMVAMKAASDASEDMIKILTRTYNRARQSQITMELLDIMGGAEALT